MLTQQQYHQLYEKGFLQIPGLVSQDKINVALRAINHSVGNGMNRKDMESFRSRSFCPELLGRPVILDLLYESPLMSLAESASVPGLKLAGGGQIALRFPLMEKPGQMHPHIDGLYSPQNGVRKGTLFTFTMLAGVFLSDVSNEYWGNFVVWPESHRIYEAYFREHGPGVLRKKMPEVKLPEPRQILAKPGDAVLCHYQLGHTVAINVSPYVRYAVFFRLSHPDHSSFGEKVFSDLWMEWPGVRKSHEDTKSQSSHEE